MTTLEIGDTLQFTATAVDSLGQVVHPQEKFVWQSSNPSVAHVDSTGRVITVAAGQVTISATLGGKRGEGSLVIPEVSIVQLSISAPPLTVVAGDTVRLSASATTTTGRVVVNTGIEWISLNPTLAAVISSGVVTTARPGIAQVVARSNAVADTAVLVITSADTTQVRVTEAEFGAGRLFVGSTLSGTSDVVRGTAVVALSSQTAQLVMLHDEASALRGLIVTLPPRPGAPAPMINASSTAAALIFLTPGILTNKPDSAATRLTAITRLSCFSQFAAYLRTELPLQNLSAVMKTPAGSSHVDTCLREYGQSASLRASRIRRTVTSGSYSFSVTRSFPARASVLDELANSGLRRVDVWEEQIRADGSSTVTRRLRGMEGVSTGLFSGAPGVPNSDTPGRETLTSPIPPGSVVASRIWIVGPGKLTNMRLPSAIQQDLPSAFIRLHGQTYWDYVVLQLLSVLPFTGSAEVMRDAFTNSQDVNQALQKMSNSALAGDIKGVTAGSIELTKTTVQIIIETGEFKFTKILKIADLFDNGIQLTRFFVDMMLLEPDRLYFDLPPSFGRVQRTYGDRQSGQAGSLLANPVGVRVVGETGGPLSGVRVKFTAQDGGALVPSDGRATTNSNGEAFVQWRLGGGTGEHRLSAAVTSDANAEASGSPAAFVVFAGGGGGGGNSVCTSVSSAELVSETVPDGSQVTAGQAFTKTWTLRNAGNNCVWDSRIKLEYVSHSNGRLSTTQVAVSVTGTVQPNGTFAFSLPMKAPGSAGTYREDWKLVDGSGNTIKVGNSNTVWAQVVVLPTGGTTLCTAASGADFIGENFPDNTQVPSGQSFTKTWTLRNAGSNCIWDSRIKLQYGSNTAGQLSTSQTAVAVSGTVQPNGSFVFSVPMKAPSSAGTYREDWKLVDGTGNTIKVGNSNTVWAQVVVQQSGPSLCTAGSGAVLVSENYRDNSQVPAGQSFTKTWTLRNLGSNCIWDSQIKLQYVSNTAGQISTSQAAVAVSGTVQPNGTFVFSVPMKAPGSAGTYREDWKLVDANGGTIKVGSSNTVWAQIVVPSTGPSLCTAASGSVLVSENYPDNTQVTAGQAFTKTWTLRNSGSNCVWDSRIRLQYVSNSAGQLSTSQAAVAVSGTVQPNGTFVFSVPMKAPGSAGTYREDWKLVDANGGTIKVGSSNTVWAQIVVPSTGPSLCTAGFGSVLVSENYPDNTQVPAGQSFTKTWTLRNLAGGNCVWDSRIKLQYVSNTAGQISTSQAAVAVTGTVQPNGTFVFSVPMKAPSSAGTFREDWKLVDANGGTIKVGNSNTVWAQIVVPLTSPPPQINSISPASPTAGSSNQQIHINGSGFRAGLTVNVTYPGGSSTLSGNQILNVTATGFDVLALLGTAGSYSFKVNNPVGGQSNTFGFQVQAPPAAAPQITSISPASPTAGSSNQQIHINGSGFRAGLTVSVTYPGGSSTLSGNQILNVTATGFDVLALLGTAGSYSFKVNNPGGGQSNTFGFQVQAPPAAAPQITSISPASPTAGSSNQQIHINGSGFRAGLTVSVTYPGGSSTLSGNQILNVTATGFDVLALLGTAGSYSFKVNNPGGGQSNTFGFQVR